MPDKSFERDVLLKVYRQTDFASIQEGERPDFVLHPSNGQPFGVEIPEFFHSGSDARLRKIPDYFERLLDGARRLHKDDEAILVDDITIISPDGTPLTTTKAIVQKLPPADAYSTLIKHCIAAKNHDLPGYRQDVSHTNLLVYDHGYRLAAVPPEHFTDVVLSDPVREALSHSGFREVYFITRMQPPDELYHPLKRLVLVSELFLFNAALMHLLDSRPHAVNAEYDQLSLFCWHMRARGYEATIRPAGPGTELLFGNSGALIENNGLVIHDYRDEPMPSGGAPEAPSAAFQTSFIAEWTKLSAANRFCIDLSQPARKPELSPTQTPDVTGAV